MKPKEHIINAKLYTCIKYCTPNIYTTCIIIRSFFILMLPYKKCHKINYFILISQRKKKTYIHVYLAYKITKNYKLNQDHNTKFKIKKLYDIIKKILKKKL